MVDYVEAIKRPITDTTSLIYGAVLGVLSFLVIPMFLIEGYALGVAKNAASGTPGLPKWENWVELLIKGILVVIISIIYLIIPTIVLSAGMGSMIMGLMAGDTSGLAAAAGAGGVMLLVGGILYLIALLILPIAMVAYANEGNFGAAFKFGSIIKKVLSLKYIITWIVVVVYSVVVYSVLTMVTVFMPFIGMGIAGYLVAVTGMDMFGQVYKETA